MYPVSAIRCTTMIRTSNPAVELPKVVDPILLKAAQKIYRTYCEVNPNMVKRPTGVVINQLTYRGQLLFPANHSCHKNVLYR